MPPGPESGGSTGGGSSGGGSYTPPSYQPFTNGLKSSDGSTIGNITGKSWNQVTFHAEKGLDYSNNTVVVGITGDMSSAPSSPKLDILPLDIANISMPLDARKYSSLLAFNLTRYCSGGDWPLQGSSVHLTLRVPVELLNRADLNRTFYLIKDDGKRIIMYEAVPAIADGIASFDIPLWYEANSPSSSGIFTLASTNAQAASNTTATSTPTPAPAQATPTPKATGSNASVLLLVAALGITAIFISRGRKQ
jgi:hypothetical protein